MKSNWNYPTTIWVGKNRINDLSIACKNLNIKKPLFVTDKDLIELQVIKNVLQELKKNIKQISIFCDFFRKPRW